MYDSFGYQAIRQTHLCAISAVACNRSCHYSHRHQEVGLKLHKSDEMLGEDRTVLLRNVHDWETMTLGVCFGWPDENMRAALYSVFACHVSERVVESSLTHSILST